MVKKSGTNTERSRMRDYMENGMKNNVKSNFENNSTKTGVLQRAVICFFLYYKIAD